MQNSRLFIFLKSLTLEEFRWLNKFIRSPFYNSNQHIIKLYELLRKYYPEFHHSKLTPEHLYKKLFPNENYDSQRFRLIMHRFANVVEEFMVAMHLKNHTFQSKKLLTKELGDRNIFPLFQRKTDELLAELAASPIRDQHYYYNVEALNMSLYAHPATNRQQKGMEQLASAMESLDDYFALSKLRLACALKAREHTLSEQFEFNLLNVILENSTRKNLLISIYAKVWELQKLEDNIKLLEDVRTLFIKNLDKIGQEDKRNILQILLNFCTRLVHKGESQFIYNIFELYKIGLEHHCLLFNNKLSEETFTNMVTSATGCGEFDWAKYFIEQYGNHLDDTNRSDAIAYSWAIWYFRQQKFEKTIDLILNHSFSKPFQIVRSKSLLIRTYVELFLQDNSYYELSIAQINTFLKYMRNNKVRSPQTTDAYLNFGRYTKKFIKLKHQFKLMNDLEMNLKASDNIILKSWLLEKIRQ